MLFRFEIVVECEKEFANRNMGSLFHGVLMEQLPVDYAQVLHENTLKPFSQYVIPCEEGMLWTVNCLNDECAQQFERVLMHGKDSIYLKDKGQVLTIASRSMQSKSYKKLIDENYFGEGSRLTALSFKTPVSFKNDGRYMIFPDMASIYKNLMRRFDTFSDEYSMYDEETVQSLIEKTAISAYNLRSTVYHMESVRIPSFFGSITVKNTGAAQLGNLARLLFRFGEFSGLGIKTALGMGAVEVKEVRNFAK